METYYTYKGYGIRYYSLNGTTEIENMGFVINTFEREGYLRGKELAEAWIDKTIRRFEQIIYAND